MKIVYRLLFILMISMFLFGCGEKTASIEGKIIDGSGKPLPGISVIFKQVQPTKGYEQFEIKTGPDGSFNLPGFAPSSDYAISLLSDKWKSSKFTRKIKTPEAGGKLVLAPPLKIRFQYLKNGTVLDTQTGLQWKIYSVKDITASTVLSKVKSLNEAGFTDWRLPTRDDLASLIEGKPAALKTGGEQAPVVKTCCAWVVEPNSQDVDWKFYVEEDNELFASNKETPDNRIIIVRNSSTFVPPPPPAAKTEPSPSVPPAKDAAAPLTTAAKEAKSEKVTLGDKAQVVAKTEPVLPPSTVKTTESPKTGAASVTVKDKAKVADKAPTAKQEPAKMPPKPESAMAATSNEGAQNETLYFGVGSTKLSGTELTKLKNFYSKIKGNKGAIIIAGHSDASLKKDLTAGNLLISMQRSSNVAAALKQMGLDKKIKIELRAFGDSRPITSNDTAEGQNKNRRAEISFVAE